MSNPKYLEYAKKSLYEAETEAWTLFPERVKLTTFLGCQRYINRITRTMWFINNFGRYRIKVAKAPKSWGHFTSAAEYTTKKIFISDSMRTKQALLHELAHIVTSARGHGVLFYKNYFKIVKKFYPKVHTELRKKLRKVGIMVP